MMIVKMPMAGVVEGLLVGVVIGFYLGIFYIRKKENDFDKGGKHGAMWIKMTGMMPPEYTGHYECSNCRWHGKREIEIDYKFCPNCGAEMSKEKIPSYPCKTCCSPSEQAACCGCSTERDWQKRYGQQV